MSNEKYSVIIVFVDGERLIVENVNNYGRKADLDVFYVEVNGYRQFFSANQFKYIGQTSCLT